MRVFLTVNKDIHKDAWNLQEVQKCIDAAYPPVDISTYRIMEDLERYVHTLVEYAHGKGANTEED